ncbi:MAG: ABC transporter permease [Candidatus Eisenbacteria bacterium]|nr:ABC transporter permease [Candidatus Eisenbacteria bacterium]
MFRRIKPIVVKEFRQVARDKRTLGVLLFIPAFMLVMFGYALNFDVKHIPMAVYDEDRSKTSRDFASSFVHSEYFDLKYHLKSTREIDDLMGDEKIKVALVIPRDFSKQLLAGRDAVVQVIIDGANSNTASTAVGYVSAVVQSYSTNILTSSLLRIGHAGFSMPIDYRPRVWYNPELKSEKFLVPGLIAFILMVIAVISTSLSVVRETERGTMEQIVVSPIKPTEFIIGKTIPYVVISLLATVAILAAGSVLFGVSVKGSYILLFVVTLVFLMAGLGLGLLISTIAETQQLAFMLAVIMTMLPTFILSGFVFPIRNMPIPIQAITYLVPARYFLAALRGIVLKGVGLPELWSQLVFLLVFAALAIGASSVRMRRVRV